MTSVEGKEERGTEKSRGTEKKSCHYHGENGATRAGPHCRKLFTYLERLGRTVPRGFGEDPSVPVVPPASSSGPNPGYRDQGRRQDRTRFGDMLGQGSETSWDKVLGQDGTRFGDKMGQSSEKS